MITTITSTFTPSWDRLNKVATLIDWLGFITLLVIGILAVNQIHFSIPQAGQISMIAGGILGLAVLAMRKIPQRQFKSFYDKTLS